MLSSEEVPVLDHWNQPIPSDPQCEMCGRSIVTRFGGLSADWCDSCDSDWHRELKQVRGMVEDG